MPFECDVPNSLKFCLQSGRPGTMVAAGQSLATVWESLPSVRKRFRKGKAWIREPGDGAGENSLQTTKALAMNFAILKAVLQWMPAQKLSVKTLEPQAGFRNEASYASYMCVSMCAHGIEFHIYTIMYSCMYGLEPTAKGIT